MSQLTITDAQLMQLRTAVAERVANLTEYVGWIRNRPALPLTELAIREVEGEIRSYQELRLHLIEGPKR